MNMCVFCVNRGLNPLLAFDNLVKEPFENIVRKMDNLMLYTKQDVT